MHFLIYFGVIICIDNTEIIKDNTDYNRGIGVKECTYANYIIIYIGMYTV